MSTPATAYRCPTISAPIDIDRYLWEVGERQVNTRTSPRTGLPASPKARSTCTGRPTTSRSPRCPRRERVHVISPRAAAVVTGLGAPLSHASIVARGLGIPAVAGTGWTATVMEDHAPAVRRR
ncbi:PEP-utilizing enzyme [Spongiactinospora gelatinilytica]|uniref:PEP-utilizing enzyme n=1 Tax=Spongiactinospora gelatinilytica TaxID=2666298 RepID=UPI001F388FBB|nr:PEP-utilizing enzyme [Spongiactinospora gelatinilytica]